MNDGPLKGLLVLDLTRVLVGPYCTMVLSDLGARIIKVEAPEIGDDSRKFGPFIEEQSAYFMSLNRGKESIALNLKNEEDKKIFEKILAKADILVENFKPPIFWKEKSMVKEQLKRWDKTELKKLMELIYDTEIECKKNYDVSNIILQQFIVSASNKSCLDNRYIAC